MTPPRPPLPPLLAALLLANALCLVALASRLREHERAWAARQLAQETRSAAAPAGAGDLKDALRERGYW